MLLSAVVEAVGQGCRGWQELKPAKGACRCAAGSTWAGHAARWRLELAQQAEQPEANRRFLDAERLWLTAARVAPWGRAELRGKWTHARERRLLAPAAVVTLPPPWRCKAIGTRGDKWRLFVHRLHHDGASNGQAALVAEEGWFATIPAKDDFAPHAFFRPDAAYMHTAGRITRIPLDTSFHLQRSTANIGVDSNQVELGWKAGQLCVLAGLEHPALLLLLDPVTLQTASRVELKLPIDLLPSTPDPDVSTNIPSPDGSTIPPAPQEG